LIVSEAAAAQALALLEAGGAATIAHPGGTLLSHLVRTADLLARWGASQDLVIAGLCHAAYGTDGFDVGLLDVDDRARLVEVIGATAESIVYLYASCDRRFTYPEIAAGRRAFRNRFTGQVSYLSLSLRHHFMELTFANELDIAAHNPASTDTDWTRLARLFGYCRHLVSHPAWDAFQNGMQARRLVVDHGGD
jgi:hypothetical protein